MEPNKAQNNSVPSGTSPQRKIVFNAPGMQYGVTSPAAPSQNPTLGQVPSDKKENNDTSAFEYNAQSVIKGKKGGTFEAKPEPELEKKPLVNPAFRSFAHDIKDNVSDRGVSLAQIVMEEERKRQAANLTTEDIKESREKSGVLKIVLIVVGIIAIIGGGIALFITFRTISPVDQITTPEDYSPIRAQKVTALELRDGYKNTLIQAMSGVAATRVSEETFLEIKLIESVGTSSVPVSFSRMMEILDARFPETLARSSTGEYVVGMYGGVGSNVPFVMFSVDAFDNAYVGMKEWEQTIIGDIGGLFINEDMLSVILASSTPSLFQDKVYYNKDTRVVVGENGKPLLVWAIVDRTNIVITRDGETLNTLMNRITLENIRR